MQNANACYAQIVLGNVCLLLCGSTDRVVLNKIGFRADSIVYCPRTIIMNALNYIYTGNKNI